MRNADEYPSTRSAYPHPILDGRNRIVQMLQNMTRIDIVELIVLVDVHGRSIAHIFIVMDAIGQADCIRSIVCINPATSDVNPLAIDVFPVKAFLDSPFMCLPGLRHV